MAGGAGAGNGSDVFDGAAIDSAIAESFGATPTTAQQTAPSDAYYQTMTRPGDIQSQVAQAYQQALGRAPEDAGRDYWAGKVQELGWTGQELAQNLNQAGAAERGQTGYQSQLNPESFKQQALNRISYYNTNPYAVDYANIFNPQVGSVLRAQPTMTPQQQAQYLGDWRQDYQSGIQRGLDQTKADRIAKADAAMQTYQAEKAKTDVQAEIDAAVAAKEAEMAQDQSFDPYNNYYNVGKAGGMVPSGLRSIRRK